MTTIADLKIGDRVRITCDWGCVPRRAIRTVQQDKDGNKFVRCMDLECEPPRRQKHYLDGQVNEDGGHLVGLELVA